MSVTLPRLAPLGGQAGSTCPLEVISLLRGRSGGSPLGTLGDRPRPVLPDWKAQAKAGGLGSRGTTHSWDPPGYGHIRDTTTTNRLKGFCLRYISKERRGILKGGQALRNYPQGNP